MEIANKSQAENGVDNNTVMTPLRVKQSIAVNSPAAPAQAQADWNETDNTKTSYIKNKPSIPSKTSDLTNDSGYIADSSYVHTDNNYTSTEKNKLSGIQSGAEVNVQSNWNETNSSSDAYIKNKPSIPTKTSDLTNDSGYITGYTETDPVFSASAAAGITSSDITNWNNKVSDASYVHTDNNYTTTEKNKLAGIAAGAEVNVQADWSVTTTTSDAFIKNKPTIPTKTSDLTNDSNFVADASYVHTDNNYTTTEKNKLSGIASGAEVNVQSDWSQSDNTKDDFIKNKPTIPTQTSQLTNNSGFITKSVNNLDNYTLSSSLSTVATSGSYNDLSNKPTIPTVNNATLTIQKNGTNVQTFTANQSTNATANITVPTKTSDLTNDSGYISSSQSTVGGTNRPIYLNNGTPTQTNTPASGNWFKGVPFVTNDGVMEIGRYIDFHPTNASTLDFSKRLDAGAGTTARTLTLPDKTGTLACTSDIPTKVSQLTNDSGYTTNTGTITGIKMNNVSKGTSGVVDLGTVITSHQTIKTINNTSMTGSGNVAVQPTLVSGTNIKTINGQTLLGSGDIQVGGGVTVNNAKLTIQKNGTTVNTFTANASTDVTANISVPTQTSGLTNNGENGTLKYLEKKETNANLWFIAPTNNNHLYYESGANKTDITLANLSDIPSTTTGTLSITKTSGSSNADGTYALYGNVMSINFHMTTTAAVASGSDLFVGKINNFNPAVVTCFVGYTGARSVVASVGTDGSITVRNASSSSIAKNTSVSVRGTVIIV